MHRELLGPIEPGINPQDRRLNYLSSIPLSRWTEIPSHKEKSAREDITAKGFGTSIVLSDRNLKIRLELVRKDTLTRKSKSKYLKLPYRITVCDEENDDLVILEFDINQNTTAWTKVDVLSNHISESIKKRKNKLEGEDEQQFRRDFLLDKMLSPVITWL